MSFIKYLKDLEKQYQEKIDDTFGDTIASKPSETDVVRLELIKDIIEQYSKTETKKWQTAFNYLPEEVKK